MMSNKWFKDARIYHIYTPSFYDGNGDGIGDLAGIAEKLDYVADLGFNTIWLSPFFTSPFQDGGYDIADYKSIDARFGDMDDFEMLVQKAKRLNIRILLDLVIGHTSDQHFWFKQSQKAERNKYSDFYHWSDNCFESTSGISIKGLSERDGAYMVNFFAFQPALNYGYERVDKESQMHYTDPRLKPLRDEISDIMRFWLKRGASGFRVDMASSLIKNNETGAGLKWLWNELIGNVKQEFPEAVFMGEWGNPSFSVGECGFDCDFLFHENKEYNDLFRNEPFDNISRRLERGKNYFSSEGKGRVEDFLKLADKLSKAVEGCGYYALPSGNHDLIRVSHNKTDSELAVAYAFLLTFDAIPIFYYGDEIGMKYQKIPTKDGGYVRTGSRLPMQWNDDKNAGFSTDEWTYYPAFIDKEHNVAAQNEREDSLLNTVKKLNMLRAAHPALSAGAETIVVECQNGGYPLAYIRKCGEDVIYVAINPGSLTCELENKNITEDLLAVNAVRDGEKITLNKNSFYIGKQRPE